MLPVVNPQASVEQLYLDFLSKLAERGFKGDIEHSYASRLAVATDNSVYQALPQAVVLPKDIDDLSLLGCLSAEVAFEDVRFSPRGGGTGTNGQSLTSGIVVDVSRYMNRILEFNQQENWVRVQAGVVKDQLNAFLRPFGYFFAPDLSTSNRATIGGMVSTDASGQGSLVYGKTSDHVLGLTSVLFNGERLDSYPIDMQEASKLAEGSGIIANLYRQLQESCVGKRQQVVEKFPRLNRFLTGYDLEHAYDEAKQQVDLSRLITGAEGSLAFVAEAKLNVIPIAKFKALVNIKYDSFESALRHAPQMVAAQATSVETVDSKVLNLAREDIIWHSVKDMISDVPGKDMQGLNMVEYNSESEADFADKLDSLSALLDDDITQQRNGVIGYQITRDNDQISKIYAMRKKAVGLLGKAKGAQKPIAFAEDTAVPPENLADFILEFRALLDAHGLQYGMFGHVDAGVLHVRPALDMCDPAQEILMKQISDQVVALVAKYGGLMWGEHGKGYRSEYSPAFFGDELYRELQKVKRAFDPLNKLNPGKICTPFESTEQLVKVDAKKRGAYDRQIPVAIRNDFAPALNCNGNGLCFNFDPRSAMCPSSKITSDRRHSPKGRAGMMREWLRLLANQDVDIKALEQQAITGTVKGKLSINTDKDDFSHEVKEVMDGCLACKACSSQCPINVDVPTFRARFLAMYHQRYKRPLKDILVSNVEKMAPLLAKIPRLVNSAMNLRLTKRMLSSVVGYVDAPLLSVPTLNKRVGQRFAFNLEQLKSLSAEDKDNTVMLVQDPFTSFYEAEVVEDYLNFMQALGYNAVLLPFVPNGKPQHVKGFLAEFAQTAKTAADFLNQLSTLGIPMIGVDPSLVLCYRDEYATILGDKRGNFDVKLIHEWLNDVIELPKLSSTQSYYLFSHCTESTALPLSAKQWQTIFARCGLELHLIDTGCCGMAGTYGHEKSNLDNSIGLFRLSWQPQIESLPPEQVLATGYSCRSQVKRIEGFKPQHPVQLLNQLMSLT
ncbi:D-2-hydroxyglutarate dehydrogenase YdiJ [Neptunicella marina]|uniref:D-2-hydroxyglutarate dehydrogenase n=1 Tax=Neptunicella marina TaxID=2125989 RepID=A0A8J6IR23_9ALTE|nr:FAD-binding and (Fe-S)-binding domain-containing protein [Neptunicella marina]MBC3764295.1 FAD-binding oxidoreductase [Neptunicella marina]